MRATSSIAQTFIVTSNQSLVCMVVLSSYLAVQNISCMAITTHTLYHTTEVLSLTGYVYTQDQESMQKISLEVDDFYLSEIQFNFTLTH